METKYPTLRRPKRKLCYLTNKESPLKQWTGTLTLGDIDKMFDDLDPPSHVTDDTLTPSALLQTFDIESNQCEREASPVTQEGLLTEQLPRGQMNSKVDALHPALSPSPKLDIDLDIPFKAHMPVKMSSPIEVNVVVEELDNKKDQVVSPILFACEDEGKEEAKTEPLLIQDPQHNGHGTEENDSEWESPPSKVVFSKPKMSSHQKKVEASCKEKTPKKPQTPELEVKIQTPWQENAESAVRQEPELTAPKKKSENVHSQPSGESTGVAKDITSFLQKLRGAGQPKPACSRKSLTPEKVAAPPEPPEPEEDFLILEDDRPLWFSIPSKTATSKKPRQGRTSSTDKDSSTDKETAQKQQESEQAKDKLGSQTVNQKTRKTKGGEKKNKVAEPGSDEEELSSPEDLPAGDLMVEEKPNKKNQRRRRKVTSLDSDKEEEPPKDGASGETHEEKPAHATEKKAPKSSDTKRPKSLKDGNEKAKTSRAKSLKGGRKGMQGSDAAKQAMSDEAERERSRSSEEHADAEDLGSLPDKEILNSEAETDKRNKTPAVSDGSSSEDHQILGKRKKRPPGQWWSGQQIIEETKVTDDQPTLKKSKQHNQEPSAAAPSPVETKKDRVLKKRKQMQPAPPSTQNTNKAKGKKTKRNKNTTKDSRPDEVFQAIEAEQYEEQQQQQQEDQDQDLDGQSSRLVLSRKDHSLNSGDRVFERVYHRVSNETLSITPVPGSPRGWSGQLRAAESEKRRRRKAPGNWWKVDDLCEDVESISSQQPGPRPRTERKEVSKRSRIPRLGTPTNGNMAVSSKPRRRAPVSLLEVKPTSAPKTVKHSLATFKDIFTSVSETPVNRRERGQKHRRKVAARPAEEVTATVCTIFSGNTDGDILRVEPGSPQNSPPNNEMPQDSTCQSENRLKILRSGPSSIIELKEYEEDENLILVPPSFPAALSASDLCAPPLKPLVLQPKDKANLTEWFKSLWSVPVDKGAEVTPDQFDWYFYQGRAFGVLVDLNCASFCNGKILLGSYMKKPLWVDHSATTVFNLLTSSVSVSIDGKESCFNPGQSFMVPCGHAYNIQNVMAQPAVLYFTRILAESSD
ncbi:uncharacterized protein LOC116385269 [Anarrhichthys ocellatus]|uniref:uncharacterized protein LOC116385269 n=1 Tax=Anarrhichthys ocellatus TaxID=433405 RepID=UPI0012EE092E|nr:uncharacterized protein LOC116385269 [Anarrhichthys ocellatus]